MMRLKGINISNISNWLRLLVTIAVLLSTNAIYAAGDMVGKVSFIVGEGMANQNNERKRVLKKQNTILEGDIVETRQESYLIILFEDGAGITIRPNSRIHIKEYDDDYAELILLKGGIRAVTGKIAKNDPARFIIKTKDSKIIPREDYSDYSVRICQVDCDTENKEMFPPRMRTSLPVIAKVVAMKGTVVVGRRYKRQLAVGHSVYSTEHLVSGIDSYAHLQFKDGTSVSLQANSVFDITDYKYNEPGFRDSAAFKLIAGGLRFVTGLMAKKDPSSFAVNSRVVTIGVRGTDFSINCFGSCNSGGAVTHVKEGRITQQNQSGVYVLDAGYYSTISSPQAAPVVTSVAPFFENNIAPEPSKIKVDTQSLFVEDAAYIEPGIYVSTRIGSLSMQGANNETVILGVNQSGYIGRDGIPANAGHIKNFQSLDPMAIAPVPESLIGKFMAINLADFDGSKNTIFIGEPTSIPAPTAAATVGATSNTHRTVSATSVTNTVIIEQTIATPY